MTAVAETIYFDNAATTALDPVVLEAMMPYLTEKFGNPSSIYSYGRQGRMAIEQSRKTVAKILGANPGEIFFTSGGTESSNTAITAAIRDLGCRHIISSPLEHHATLHSVEFFARQAGIPLSWVKILPNGHFDTDDLERLLREAGVKCLVSLMHANNEIGNMMDIDAVGTLCEKYGAVFHSDTVQTVGHFPFNLRNTPVHFITGASHKFHGPKGVGILFVRDNIQILPYLHGGSQERNMRAGTENVYGIVGFARALELATANYKNDREHIAGLKKYMMEQLQEQIPAVHFNGDPGGNSLYTVVSASFPRSERSDMLLFNLDINHICASGGSACSSGAEQGSHVIRALGGDPDLVTVRFSFCRHNTCEEIRQVVTRLKELL